MKRHRLFIKPRASGKTMNILMNIANENEMGNKESFVLIPSAIRRSYDDYVKGRQLNVFEVLYEHNVCLDIHQKHQYKTMYIDEYFALTIQTREWLFNYMFLGPHRVYAYGTPRQQFRKQDVDEVTMWWKYQFERRKIAPILKAEQEMVDKYGADLMYCLLVHPCVETIMPMQLDMEKILSKEVYEMEILGKIFKEK